MKLPTMYMPITAAARAPQTSLVAVAAEVNGLDPTAAEFIAQVNGRDAAAEDVELAELSANPFVVAALRAEEVRSEANERQKVDRDDIYIRKTDLVAARWRLGFRNNCLICR